MFFILSALWFFFWTAIALSLNWLLDYYYNWLTDEANELKRDLRN